jgi:hypothetical protein
VIWLVLRRQRAALLLALALAAAVAVALVAMRLGAPSWASAEAMAGCPGRAAPCPGEDEIEAWVFGGGTLAVVLVLWLLPAAVGIVAGAGLFGGEISHGTHVFGWTQSIGRLRWWTTGLLVTGVPVAALVGLLSLLAGWALAPLRAVFGTGSLLDPTLFAVSGLLPMAYALLGFGLAAVAGLLLRNGLGAVALAAVACLAVQLGVGGLRAHYTPPQTAESTEVAVRWGVPLAHPQGAWIIGEGHLDARGEVVPPQTVVRAQDDCLATSAPEETACLRAIGVASSYLSYHPADRFWRFQLTETAIVLGLLAAVLAIGPVGLRRPA